MKRSSQKSRRDPNGATLREVEKLIDTSVALAEQGQCKEALQICDEVISQCGATKDPEICAVLTIAYLNKGILQGELDRFGIHIGHHQHLLGVGILNNRRDQAV